MKETPLLNLKTAYLNFGKTLGATSYLSEVTFHFGPLSSPRHLAAVPRLTERPLRFINELNRPNDERYILRFIGQVITVSLETQQILADLPSINLPA